MASLIPCMKAKMGDNEYYIASLAARELTSMARPAKETDQWASQSLEERLQRDLNENRIKREIAPYLATQSDRLFGSVVVLMQGTTFDFEPLEDIVKNLPKAYKSAGAKHGFLTVEGGELIMLDGQHRFGALRSVIQGEVEGQYANEVANDQVSVIFLPEVETQRTRHIFNRINRYAKPTSRGDNIITSEDDGFAIVARQLLEVGHGPLGVKTKDGTLIVNWKSNTISERSLYLTTLSALYETVKDIISTDENLDFSSKPTSLRPEKLELEDAFALADRWWSQVLKNVSVYSKAIQSPESLPKLREKEEKSALLLKPVTQIALFRGLTKATNRGKTLEEATKEIDKIDFSFENDLWTNVLLTPNGRMLTKKENQDVASDLIAYLIAKDKTKESIQVALREKIADLKNEPDFELPQ